jgi:hypothetical protein
MRKLHHKPAIIHFPQNILGGLLAGQLYVIKRNANGATSVLPCNVSAFVPRCAVWGDLYANLASHTITLDNNTLSRCAFFILSEANALTDGLAQGHGQSRIRPPSRDAPRNGDAIAPPKLSVDTFPGHDVLRRMEFFTSLFRLSEDRLSDGLFETVANVTFPSIS